jgi:hypothetical protein
MIIARPAVVRTLAGIIQSGDRVVVEFREMAA